MLALKEIKQYQKSTNLLIKKLPFQRLVREIAMVKDVLRSLFYNKNDVEWIQKNREVVLVHIFLQKKCYSIIHKYYTYEKQNNFFSFKGI